MTDQDPYLIISSDCHAGLPTEEYRPYLDARFHRDFDEFLARTRRGAARRSTRLGIRNEAFAAKWFQDNEEGLRGGWDAAQRLKELDGDGVAAEVVFPDADAVDSRTAAPFGVGLGLSGDQDPELGMAGAQAHNRWLAELRLRAPRTALRRRPVARSPRDGRQVVAEIHRAKESGPRRADDPVHVGRPGAVPRPPLRPGVGGCRRVRGCRSSPTPGAAPRARVRRPPRASTSPRSTWWPARPLWFLLWSGVFERHPGLRFGVAESGCWWLPNLLWFMDRLYLGAHGGKKLVTRSPELKRPPSEYLDRQLFICATNTKRRELGPALRDRRRQHPLGQRLPAPRGHLARHARVAAPTFHDIPMDETRRMLGLAAAEVFGFDVGEAGAAGPPDRPDAGRPRPARTTRRPSTASWARSREVGPALADRPRLPGPGGGPHEPRHEPAPRTATPSSPPTATRAPTSSTTGRTWRRGTTTSSTPGRPTYVNPYEDLLADTGRHELELRAAARGAGGRTASSPRSSSRTPSRRSSRPAP